MIDYLVVKGRTFVRKSDGEAFVCSGVTAAKPSSGTKPDLTIALGQPGQEPIKVSQADLESQFEIH